MRQIGVRTLLAALALVLMPGFGCVKGVVQTDMGLQDTGKKMVIAVYPTEYKNLLAQDLADRFKDRAGVTLLPIKDLNTVQNLEYDVLVIVDQLMAWQMFNFESNHFLRRLDDPDARKRVVLYLTAGSPKDDYKFQGIDAITGASAMDRRDQAVDAISARIDAVLDIN